MDARGSVGWFCALLDDADDVYFRYTLVPTRRFAYISPSVAALTGSTADQFYRDPDFCLALIEDEDRPVLRRILRSRRSRVSTIRILRHGTAIPIAVRTVALTRRGKVVAIEGVAALAVVARPSSLGRAEGTPPAEPIQPRLAALMCEVHELLHRAMPMVAPAAATTASPGNAATTLRAGPLALDLDRLIVTESGRTVPLPSRELLLLRYLLQRPGRVVTRAQALADVWHYSYTGDDRTVDVHISRLRRRLPSLRRRLVAIRNVGYRLDIELAAEPRVANS
ncbi:MAG: response regulator transcription factor [Acidobacteria bacterium]|nr:response regulator transcription factor [Acidobacteriota bacterium]